MPLIQMLFPESHFLFSVISHTAVQQPGRRIATQKHISTISDVCASDPRPSKSCTSKKTKTAWRPFRYTATWTGLDSRTRLFWQHCEDKTRSRGEGSRKKKQKGLVVVQITRPAWTLLTGCIARNQLSHQLMWAGFKFSWRRWDLVLGLTFMVCLTWH